VPTVRKAEPRDADAVLALLEALGRAPVADDPEPQREVFRDHLSYDDALVLVAEEEGVVAGLATLWFRPRLNSTAPEAWLADLFVAPERRRRGLGRALVEACVAAARRRRCHRLVLQSGNHRQEAHALYERCGLELVGRHYRLEL
jgi:GNAT superfamily N-acetyltransferase